MDVGLLVESEHGLDWRHWRALYRRADRDGFSSIRVSDHLASPWSGAHHGLEAWVALTVAAAETSRVRFGPLVSPVTFRAPALVARMAEALSDLSDGRFVLGLGLGWNADEHRRFGLPFPSTAERSRLLDQAVPRIRAIVGDPWPRTGGASTTTTPVEHEPSEPRPMRSAHSRRIPIVLGGSGKRQTLPLVARHADEWNMTTASPAAYAAAVANLTDACATAGRDFSTLRRSIAAGVLVGRDDADLVERGWRLAAAIPPLAQALAGLQRATHTHEAARLVRQAAESLGWLAGTPAELRTQLAPFGAHGVDEAILGVYDFDDVAAVDLIASELVSAVR